MIEAVGKITEVTARAGASRIGIASTLSTSELADGESVAVDGVCLTVAERRRDRFLADVVSETLGRTTLGRLRTGATVNLERSLRFGDRLEDTWFSGTSTGPRRYARFAAAGRITGCGWSCPRRWRATSRSRAR